MTQYGTCECGAQTFDGVCRKCHPPKLNYAELEAKLAVALEAVRALSKDMHPASTRPCPTCQAVTNLLGEPFGCNLMRARREAVAE